MKLTSKTRHDTFLASGLAQAVYAVRRAIEYRNAGLRKDMRGWALHYRAVLILLENCRTKN